MIIVTHNSVIGEMADRVLKLHDGMITSNKLNESKVPAASLEW